MAAIWLSEGCIGCSIAPPDRALKDRILGRSEEPGISIATSKGSFAFHGDPKLPAEEAAGM